MSWKDYQTIQTEHTVTGTLKALPDFESPQLGNRRDILVYLPNSYTTSDRRYPVLYMHDGQNLFDRPVPTSLVQLWVPRVELHLFYNTIVFIPMVVAMYFHMFPPADPARPTCTCAWHRRLSPAV